MIRIYSDMPYKDPQKRKDYKIRWRLKNKHRYIAVEKCSHIRRKIKAIQKKGVNNENEQIIQSMLASLKQAEQEKSEIIRLENEKQKLLDKIARQTAQDKAKKELETIKDSLAEESHIKHNERIDKRKQLFEEIKQLEKEYRRQEQRKYSNTVLYYLKNKADKRVISLPSAEQVLLSTKFRNQKEYMERRKRAWKYVWEYKCTHACIKCGETHPAVLCFHHRDPSNKKREISKMITKGNTITAIQDEIDKCDLLCMNCHTFLHWHLTIQT